MAKICFCVPYFNHPQNIAQLCEILAAHKLPAVFVDDASTPSAKAALVGAAGNFKNFTILTHETNRGKGGAVKTAAAWAAAQGFSHIFQIDADMQHDLSQIASFLAASEAAPDALICGYGIYGGDAPKSRLYGRKITAFWVWLNTLGGLKNDTMTGFRIYPLNGAVFAATKSERMEFDIEILVRFFKFKTPFVWLPVGVKYGAPSHFGGRENWLISKMHAREFLALPRFIFLNLKRRFGVVK